MSLAFLTRFYFLLRIAYLLPMCCYYVSQERLRKLVSTLNLTVTELSVWRVECHSFLASSGHLEALEPLGWEGQAAIVESL